MRKIDRIKTILITSFIFAVFLFSGCISEVQSNTQTNKSILEKQVDQISIPISEISQAAKFYKYDYEGKTISFFAVKSSDGQLKIAFNACDVCYPEKKGYRQEGDFMVCNYCGLKFSTKGIGTQNKESGGCWPGYLPSKIEGNNITISKVDLENGKWRF